MRDSALRGDLGDTPQNSQEGAVKLTFSTTHFPVLLQWGLLKHVWFFSALAALDL